MILETYFLYSFILFGSTVFVYLYEKIKNKKSSYIFLSIAFLIIYIPAAIRYNIGSDYTNYSYAFYEIGHGIETRFEIGYQYLNYAIYSIGLSFQWLVATVSFIVFILVFKSYPKKDAWIIHFVFIGTLYLYTYSNIRSSIIYGLMFYATISYIKYKKTLPYIVCIIISILFHKAAVVYLVLPILFSKKIIQIFEKKYICEIFIFLFFILLFERHVLNHYLFHNPLTVYLDFEHYAEALHWSAIPDLGTGLGVFAQVAPLLVFILFRHKIIKKFPEAIYIIPLCLATLFAINLALSVVVAHRFDKFFYFTNFLVIYYLLISLKGWERKIFIGLVLLFYCANYYKMIQDDWYVSPSTPLKIAPYVSVFNKSDSPRMVLPSNDY